MLQDLIIAAINQAIAKAQELQAGAVLVGDRRPQHPRPLLAGD